MDVEIHDFGINDGFKTYVVSIKNDNGHLVQITNYGGIVHSWVCPDKDGIYADILLGCPNLDDYLNGHPYFGAIIGRYANRINHGRFELDGIKYQLPVNLPPHHLHGGILGFDRKIWAMDVKKYPEKCIISLQTESCHLEEGYPGNLIIKVNYTFTNDNQLIIEYFATTDQLTILNLTNHCYFNLSGNPSGNILDHEVLITADFFTKTNDSSIPTGQLESVSGTILNFKNFRKISEGIYSEDPLLKNTKGYDHNFVLIDENFKLPSAVARHKASGRVLEVYTDQPGIQLYTGNWLGGVAGKQGFYADYAGLCLETQHFPDSPNHPNFPDTTLRPGEKFYSKTIYKITKEN